MTCRGELESNTDIVQRTRQGICMAQDKRLIYGLHIVVVKSLKYDITLL